MFCSDCGAEIPDFNAFCGKCGRPIAKPIAVEAPKKSGWTPSRVILLVLLMGIVGLYFLAKESQSKEGTASPIFKAVSHHEAQRLVTGSNTVQALHIYGLRFTVAPEMKNAMVTGSFRAAGGMGNDLKALITNEAGYLNYANNHNVKAFYQSGKVTADNLNVRLDPGTYVLIFDNSFSLFSEKTYEANIQLEYDSVF